MIRIPTSRTLRAGMAGSVLVLLPIGVKKLSLRDREVGTVWNVGAECAPCMRLPDAAGATPLDWCHESDSAIGMDSIRIRDTK